MPVKVRIRKKRSRRRWRRLIAPALFVAVVGGAAFWATSAPRYDRWPDVLQAVQGKRWSEAEARLRRWLDRQPNDAAAWMLLGKVLADLGHHQQAQAAFKHVPEGDPRWAETQTLIGEVALREHDAAAADRALRAAARQDPNAVEPRRLLLGLLLMERRTDEARILLWDLYKLTSDPRHLMTLVALATDDWIPTDRFEELREFAARDRNDPWVKRAVGLALLRQGQLTDSMDALVGAAEALEYDTEGRIALAECRFLLGDLQGAAVDLDREPTRPSLQARWWVECGRLAVALNKPDTALRCWKSAVAADPDNQAAQYRLGQTLELQGEHKEAREHLERAQTVGKRTELLRQALNRVLTGGHSARAFERLGELCQEAGLRPEARAWFEQARLIDPTYESTEIELARAPDSFVPPDPIPRRRASLVATARTNRARPPELRPPCFEALSDLSGFKFQYDPGVERNRPAFIGDAMGGGVGLIDFDGDGWLDIYLVNGCALPLDPKRPSEPNVLFRNKGNGAFEDVTARAEVGGHGYGMGCAVADYDNDGHDDLFVTGLGQTVLYRNRGDGTFEDVTERAGVQSSRWSTAAGFGDLDGDGDLDLVVVTYVDADPRNVPDCRDGLGQPVHCPPDRFQAQLDHLFRNNGNGTFTDVAAEAGLNLPGGDGLGLAIADFDDDGRLDLFVANRLSRNFLFHNLGDMRFEEIGLVAGVALDGDGRATASTGVVAADLDADGQIDLFHTNSVNEPGTLLRNLGNGRFADVSSLSGLTVCGRTAAGFGTAALDADNDGSLDLFIANGQIDDHPEQDQPMAQRPQLFVGQGQGKFRLAPSSAAPYFTQTYVGRGAAAADLDNDGRVDLVVVHRDAPAAALHNITAGGSWVGLRLRGTKSGSTPVGAVVSCRVGEKTLVRKLTSGTGYLASGDPRLWFGLGEAFRIDHLEVRWPSGLIQTWSNLDANHIFDITEGHDPVDLSPRSRR